MFKKALLFEVMALAGLPSAGASGETYRLAGFNCKVAATRPEEGASTVAVPRLKCSVNGNAAYSCDISPTGSCNYSFQQSQTQALSADRMQPFKFSGRQDGCDYTGKPRIEFTGTVTVRSGCRRPPSEFTFCRFTRSYPYDRDFSLDTSKLRVCRNSSDSACREETNPVYSSPKISHSFSCSPPNMLISASRVTSSGRVITSYRSLTVGTNQTHPIPLTTQFTLSWSASNENGNCWVTNSFNQERGSGRTGSRTVVPSSFGKPTSAPTFYLSCTNSSGEVGVVTFTFFNQPR